MENPLVSIVIPTCGRASLLKETLDTIITQTYKSIEILVVLDGPDQETTELLDQLSENRLRHYTLPKSGLPSVNRNFGMQKAKGKYIAFCDDDDLWERDKLKKQVSLLEHQKKDALTFSSYSLVQQKAALHYSPIPFSRLARKSLLKTCYYLPSLTSYILPFINIIPNSSVLFHRSIIRKTGFINTDIHYRGVEDFDFYIRVGIQHRLLFTPEPLIKYRLHEANISSSKGKAEMNNKALNVLKNLKTSHKRIWPALFVRRCLKSLEAALSGLKA
tara:strand:+ start:62916 stop:63737 length:822 start_codon:yes stop_codon:yes gene_type:complete